MKYEIQFNALNTKGDVVGSGSFTITTSQRLDLSTKPMSLDRLCVEYARLTGVKCSFSEITYIEATEG